MPASLPKAVFDAREVLLGGRIGGIVASWSQGNSTDTRTVGGLRSSCGLFEELPGFERDDRDRGKAYRARRGAADASFGRLLNTTASMSPITLRCMISFFSIVICPTPGTFWTFTF